MIDRTRIERLVREYVSGTNLFLVAVKVNSSNRITVLADRNEGITIDECAGLHRYLEKNLDRNIEDFELQVSSPGLDLPFLVIEQYYKNEGHKVAVVDNEGLKYTGIMKNVTKGGFDLETEINSKGKPKEVKEIPFNFDQIKSAKTVLAIK